MNDLETFAPVPRRETVAGRDFDILPLRMRQIPAFAKAVTQLMPYVLAGDLLEVVTEHAETASEAVAIGTGAERDFIDELFPDDFLRLAMAVFEVNMDFFARRVLPESAATMARIRATLKGAPTGEPSSPGSSDTDTASVTAST